MNVPKHMQHAFALMHARREAGLEPPPPPPPPALAPQETPARVDPLPSPAPLHPKASIAVKAAILGAAFGALVRDAGAAVAATVQTAVEPSTAAHSAPSGGHPMMLLGLVVAAILGGYINYRFPPKPGIDGWGE
ncbi:MAG: hypothetical protein U1E65_00915 [Myxococcota bacterium]